MRKTAPTGDLPPAQPSGSPTNMTDGLMRVTTIADDAYWAWMHADESRLAFAMRDLGAAIRDLRAYVASLGKEPPHE